MEKPKRTRRGRAVPGDEPKLTSPLPLTTPCGVVESGYELNVDDVVEMCQNTQHQHQHSPQHHDFLTKFFDYWGVVGANSLIATYGVENVNQVATQIYQATRSGAIHSLKNPPGWIVWQLRQLALPADQHARRQPPQRQRAVGDDEPKRLPY